MPKYQAVMSIPNSERKQALTGRVSAHDAQVACDAVKDALWRINETFNRPYNKDGEAKKIVDSLCTIKVEIVTISDRQIEAENERATELMDNEYDLLEEGL